MSRWWAGRSLRGSRVSAVPIAPSLLAGFVTVDGPVLTAPASIRPRQPHPLQSLAYALATHANVDEPPSRP